MLFLLAFPLIWLFESVFWTEQYCLLKISCLMLCLILFSTPSSGFQIPFAYCLKLFFLTFTFLYSLIPAFWYSTSLALLLDTTFFICGPPPPPSTSAYCREYMYDLFIVHTLLLKNSWRYFFPQIFAWSFTFYMQPFSIVFCLYSTFQQSRTHYWSSTSVPVFPFANTPPTRVCELWDRTLWNALPWTPHPLFVTGSKDVSCQNELVSAICGYFPNLFTIQAGFVYLDGYIKHLAGSYKQSAKNKLKLSHHLKYYVFQLSDNDC